MRRPRITKSGLKSDDVRILQKVWNTETCIQLSIMSFYAFEMSFIALDVYGPNVLDIKAESYLEIFTNNILDPYYVFQIFTLILWCYAGYYYYCVGVILVASIIISIALFILRREEVRQQKDLVMDNSVTVTRDGFQYYIGYSELVPGDIVVLNKSSRYLTYDGTVIQGGLYIDNANLNGSTKTYYRATDPTNNGSHYHKLTLHGQKDSVFAGTRVTVLQPDESGEDVLVLVVNTGFLTRKGQVLKDAGHQTTTNISLTETHYSI
eukprot:sb/3468334/